MNELIERKANIGIIMSFIGAIIIGFFVGLLARAIMPGPNPAGFILTTLLGIGGALVGKYLGQALGMYKDQDSVGFFMSILGAIIILIIYHLIRRNTSPQV